MIRFNSDYTEGCHPAILERLAATNMEQTPGYGEDAYCAAAAEQIKEACAAPEAAVHFLVGGTQTNVTVISAALRPVSYTHLDVYKRQLQGYDIENICI